MRARLPWDFDAFAALRLLRGRERPFCLVGSWAGGGALLGSDPVRVASSDEDPFALLDELPDVEGEGVGGGWFGWFGYRLGERLERLPPSPPRPVRMPPFALAFYDNVLRLDSDGVWWFEALWTEERDSALHERLEWLRSALPGDSRPYSLGPFTPRPGRAGHARAVECCRRYIAEGDLYQANLCLRLDASFDGDPLDLFAATAEALEPARGAFVSGPWGAIASMSPELFLRRAGGEVVSAPIKGTSTDRAALEASAKDRAENVMIVDLMRNDLGRSSAYGSVHVPALNRVLRGPGVWHLVSEVRGTLAPGVGDGDLVRRAFPPGSVTGAPKIKSMSVIAELESTGREAYTGAIGFASPLAGLELSVAIRTFEFSGGRAWLGAGGGITSGSDPDAEYDEALTKARPLIEAAGASLREPAAGGARLPVPPTRLARPDPALGVFETILALDGELVLGKEHLGRLANSVLSLYCYELPGDLDLTPPDDGAWRVRVVAKPDGEVTVEHLEAAFPTEPLTLRPLVLPGGLGAHKWVDRSLVAEPPEPLILDLDGELLETGSGNLFIVEDGAIVTPPADARILPGVTRAGIAAREERIDVERARAADELFVTSAIRGVQSVASCEGIGRWDAGPVAKRLHAGRLPPY